MKQMKYSLGILLFLIAVVGGYFAGLDRGFEAGKKEWCQLPVFTKSYDVSKLIVPQTPGKQLGLGGAITEADFHPLIDRLKSKTLSHVWEHDSNSSIRPLVSRLSIVVTANGTMQYELERTLALEQVELTNSVTNYHLPKN